MFYLLCSVSRCSPAAHVLAARWCTDPQGSQPLRQHPRQGSPGRGTTVHRGVSVQPHGHAVFRRGQAQAAEPTLRGGQDYHAGSAAHQVPRGRHRGPTADVRHATSTLGGGCRALGALVPGVLSSQAQSVVRVPVETSTRRPSAADAFANRWGCRWIASPSASSRSSKEPWCVHPLPVLLRSSVPLLPACRPGAFIPAGSPKGAVAHAAVPAHCARVAPSGHVRCPRPEPAGHVDGQTAPVHLAREPDRGASHPAALSPLPSLH